MLLELWRRVVSVIWLLLNSNGLCHVQDLSFQDLCWLPNSDCITSCELAWLYHPQTPLSFSEIEKEMSCGHVFGVFGCEWTSCTNSSARENDIGREIHGELYRSLKIVDLFQFILFTFLTSASELIIPYRRIWGMLGFFLDLIVVER